jgi:hypothetical protein
VFTQSNGYAGVQENYYYRGVLVDFPSGNIYATTSSAIKDEIAPSGTLSVLIQNLAGTGAPEAVYDGSGYVGAAYATPEWTSEDWPEGVTPSYSYAWSYQIGGSARVPVGGSGPTLDLSLVPYGASLKCGAVATAYVDGQVVDSASPAPMVAVSVSNEIPVSFSSESQPSASSTEPQVPATVNVTSFPKEGTAPITTTYVWTRNNVAIPGANSSSYTTVDADADKTLRCVVTIDNAYGPPASRTVSFGKVEEAFVVVDVADIKLYEAKSGSGDNAVPSGPEITVPVRGRTYFAFAYASSGAQITGLPITWS